VPSAGTRGTLILLADPFSVPVEGLLAHMGATAPGLAVLGGFASAARSPGGNRLILDGTLHHDGAVGALLPEATSISAVVSQGCRPVGVPMIVTRAERNMVYELAGKPALEQLLATAASVSDADRALMRDGLHVGIVLDETRATFERGDFLVRGVLGADRDNGAVAVGEAVAVGTTLQFQIRDARSAHDDLRALLAEAGDHRGALAFTCNGRGAALFGDPHHDAQMVAEVSDTRCAGMACAGEIGPVAGRNAVHSFTASVALFG
jgi:small ligand-binding sensory domain FIST